MKIAFYYIIKEITKSEYNFMKTEHICTILYFYMYIYTCNLKLKLFSISKVKEKINTIFIFYIFKYQ